MNIDEAIEKLKAVNVGSIAYSILKESNDLLADKNREQLFDGLGRDGQYLPSYNTDPYFETPAAAIRYAVWKAKISRSKSKPDMIPDLYINGRFHKSISASAIGTGAYFNSNDINAADILRRFTTALGLNEDSIEGLRITTFNPKMAIRIAEQTGFKTK